MYITHLYCLVEQASIYSGVVECSIVTQATQVSFRAGLDVRCSSFVTLSVTRLDVHDTCIALPCGRVSLVGSIFIRLLHKNP